MLQSRFIAFADMPDGTARTLYHGPDMLAAQSALEKVIAEGQADAAGIFAQPAALHIRLPLQERLQAEQRAKEAAAAVVNEAGRKAAEASAKRKESARLIAEAKRLEAEVKTLSD